MKDTKKLTTSALLLALGIMMPFLTGQIPEVGGMLLPMHIPVLICGFACGWKYGLMVGFITPILRSVMFGMPVMMPKAVAMAFELAAYGAIAGALYQRLKGKKLATYVSLVSAMLIGRIIWGVVSVALYKTMGAAFTWEMFVAGAFASAVPGIVLQLAIIPPIVVVLRNNEMIEA